MVTARCKNWFIFFLLLRRADALGNTYTRRSLLVKAGASAAAAAAAAGAIALPPAANAKGPELDLKSGEQFIPKSDCPCMKLKREPTEEDRSKKRIASTTKGPIQDVYDVRFITYLSRFLLNFDPAAKAWFQECSCAKEEGGGFPSEAEVLTDKAYPDVNLRAKIRFAEFAESVEIGLANFFVSPEGLSAFLQELQIDNNSNAYQKIFRQSAFQDDDGYNLNQGVLNLFDLLSARFSTPEQKVQLAILFSMITDPRLQPTKQIEGLLREAPKGSKSVTINEDILENLKGNAILLLPPSYQPVFNSATNIYSIPLIPPLAADGSSLLSAQYRAVDPLFGGLGSIPVTKGAQSLDANQYSRLALSGAVCTVLVRTALNPLELVKTKMQLANDVEFNELVLQNGPRTTQHKDAVASDSHDDFAVESEEEPIHQESREDAPPAKSVGTIDMIYGLLKLRGPSALFQAGDVTLMASMVFGSFGYGATELFRRWFAVFVETDSSNTDSGLQLEAALLAASAFACIVMCTAATPFEVLRVRSMATIRPKGWKQILLEFAEEKRATSKTYSSSPDDESAVKSISNDDSSDTTMTDSVTIRELSRLWDAFPKVVSRELPFAIVKFITFDVAAGAIISIINAKTPFAGQVQVGSGAVGLAVSAMAGAVAGIAGAVVSHPADLILTLTSSSTVEGKEGGSTTADANDWRPIVQDLLKRDGGLANLFVGLPTRAIFFALVIGLQFWLYDYVKNLLQVGSDDLALVLDVFYAVGNNLVESTSST